MAASGSSLTKAEALTRLRQRLRDTSTPYNFTDALLQTYMENACRQIAVAIRDVDPDFFLTFRDVNAFTDALDPNPAGTYPIGYEYYPLPNDLASVRWIERGDGSLHYKLWDASPRDQEPYRYTSLFYGTATVDGTTLYTVPYIGGYETASIHGDRFRVIPPPAAAGPVYRVFYDRRPYFPDGDNEVMKDVPFDFEEPFVDIAAYLAADDDGDPMAEKHHVHAYGVPPGQPIPVKHGGSLGAAKDSHRKRTRRTIRLGPAW